jgi:hypothetical protein
MSVRGERCEADWRSHCDDTQRNLEDHRLPGHRSMVSTMYGMNMKQFGVARNRQYALGSAPIDGGRADGVKGAAAHVHLRVVSVRRQ